MIGMNDFCREPKGLNLATLAAVTRVLDSGNYVLGGEVLSFEEAWANHCETTYAVGVANGMDAIEIILRALDIGPGDEVVTTTMTAFATVLGILRAGAIPVLADIDPETGLMSMESVQRCVSPSTKAILLVHLYGQVKNMTKWESFCKDNELILLEDCAQAHSAREGGRVAGSFGQAAAFSFYPTKNLGAIGDAGAIVTSDAAVAERSRTLRNYGQSVRYHHVEIGLNSRLDEIQAAILSERLRWLDTFTKQRQGVAGRYTVGISNEFVSPLAQPATTESHVYHLFVVKTKHRDELQTHLMESGIQSYIHYPIPIHRQSPCVNVKRDPNGLLESELYADQCLSLPCHPQLTDDEVAQVIAAVNTFQVM